MERMWTMEKRETGFFQEYLGIFCEYKVVPFMVAIVLRLVLR